MIKVEFTAVFSTKVPGDTKEYEDQYAKWLIDEIKVAKRFHEKKDAKEVPVTRDTQHMEPLPKKEIKTIPVNKEEKHAAKRITK